MATKQRGKRKIAEGVATIQASFNNTIVSITTTSGDMISQSSAGRCGFKGSRKGTPFAAQMTAETVAKNAIENFDLKRIAIKVSGPGAGRDSAIRALYSSGLDVMSITDTTAIPHNGCRPRKKRRV